MRSAIKPSTQALRDWTRNTPLQNSKLYFILQPLQLELIIYLMSLETVDDIRRHISLYLTSLQFTKLEVSGMQITFISYKQVMILEKPYRRSQGRTLKLFSKEFWRPNWTVMFTQKRSNLPLHSKFLKS